MSVILINLAYCAMKLLPYQDEAFSKFIMRCLEDKIAVKYHTVQLDASLSASGLYEHRGYHTIKHEKRMVENGVILVYEIMEKSLSGDRPIYVVREKDFVRNKIWKTQHKHMRAFDDID